MKILCACEESQRVCKAFREKGHEAYSCDILDTSGDHPEWHIKGDVIPLLKEYWDMIIAFPPCTYLTVTGNRWMSVDNYGDKAIERQEKRYKAIEFFMRIITADCERIAVENPIGIMSTVYRKPDQIISPWMFYLYDYEKTDKRTCLWLKNLPLLKPLHLEKPDIKYHYFKHGKRQTEWYYKTRCMPHNKRAEMASKTFPGIAQAMADQWG